MGREIKFRGLSKCKTFWRYGYFTKDSYGNAFIESINPSQVRSGKVHESSVGQFTGLQDKNKKDIYKGDIISWRQPLMDTQTHTGDNIPNGSYTEPTEPIIKTFEKEVLFEEGMFCVLDGSQYIPIQWLFTDYDEEGIKCCIATGKDHFDIWDDDDCGNLQYLLDTYDLENVSQLIDYCNYLEVIGNIHQSKELLK